jgi:uncharacterized repeat protein (TIGR02543 family)
MMSRFFLGLTANPLLGVTRERGIMILGWVLVFFLSGLVNAWAAPLIVDDGGGNRVGYFPSLQVVNGNPAIGYWDETNGDLNYVRATNADGTAWGGKVIVDNGGSNNVGPYPSLRVVGGNPAISYYDITNADLKYVRATDADGTAWAVPVSVDVIGDMGQDTSLAVVNGNPAISYVDWNTGCGIKYVRANNGEGTGWGASVCVDAVTARNPSLQVVNGNPAISYMELITITDGDLKYVRATDADGTAWAAPVSVDTAGDVGNNPSLQVVTGNPAISYWDNTNGDLKYMRATDADGTAWAAPVIVDNGGVNNVGQFSSLQVVDGNPAISYYDNTNGDLKYVRAIDADGTVWAAPVSVDTVGDVGHHYTSLQVVNGNPAIGYHDDTNGDLKYVRVVYTITYNGNSNTGGAVPIDPTSYKTTDTATVLGNTGSLVRAGYTFAGWNTAANGSGSGYNAGDTFTMVNSSIMLYAQWCASAFPWQCLLPSVLKAGADRIGESKGDRRLDK